MNVVAKTVALLGSRPATKTIGPIGIDFGLEAVHLVQLSASTGERPVVHARATLPYDCPREQLLTSQHRFRTLINRAMEADRFSKRKVVIAIPSGMFRTVSINYQFSGGEENAPAAVLKVMADRLDKDLSNYVIDYMPVKSSTKKDEQLALVAVSEREPIIELLETARKARLEVDALEIGPVAISRLVGALSLASGSNNVLVINTGRRASYLTVISGMDLLFDQEVAFGENGLIEQAARTLDLSESMTRDLISQSGLMSDDDAGPRAATMAAAEVESTLSQILRPQFVKLVEEIKRVCLYAASETRGGAISHVYLLGSLSRWPGSDSVLSKLAGISVSTIPDVLSLFPSEESDSVQASETAPEIVVATGAALRGMVTHG